jgi:hypothetical protein
MAQVCGTGCSVYPNQKMDQAHAVLKPGTPVVIVPNQRWKAGTRFVIQISSPKQGWVYEDLIV